MQLSFQDAFRPDPATVKRVPFRRRRELLSIAWPAESDALLDAAQDLHDVDTEKLLDERRRVQARLPHLLASLGPGDRAWRPAVLEQFRQLATAGSDRRQSWRLPALNHFLALANFELHLPAAYALTTLGRTLPEPWDALRHGARDDWDRARAMAMEWPRPVYQQEVIQVSGEEMDRYFYVPEPWCRDAFSVTETGFVRAIVPQNELTLARDGSALIVRYDGVVKATKTISRRGDVYPQQYGADLRRILGRAVDRALASPDIKAGAGDAGIDLDELREAVDPQQAFAAAQGEIASLKSVETELARATAPGGDPEARSLHAERNALVRRVEDALVERGVSRPIRAMIDERTPALYTSALQLTFKQAPGLAELSDVEIDPSKGAAARIADLLEHMPGGSIGLAGPRGVGKTTLIRAFCSPRPGEDPHESVRVMVSAPTKYEGRDFVLHLFRALCETVLDRDRATLRGERERAGSSRARGVLRWLRITPAVLAAMIVAGLLLIAGGLLDETTGLLPLAAFACLTAGTALVFATVRMRRPLSLADDPEGPRERRLAMMLARSVGGLVLLAGVALAALALLDLAPDPVVVTGVVLTLAGASLASAASTGRLAVSGPDGEPDLNDIARERLDEIRWQQTFASGWSGALKLPVGIEGTINATRTLAQTPMSFPQVVGALRAFLEEVTVSDDARVYVGIDELDKMASEEEAQRFLNEIKGVFGLPRCFFLVSISEEAMAQFERRGARLRDVFDSAFDEVFYLDPIRFPAARDVLRERVLGFPVPYLALCHVLSGGRPRELIRLTRSALEAKPPDRDGALGEVTETLVQRELQGRARAISVAVRALHREPLVSQLVAWARDLAGTPQEPAALLDARVHFRLVTPWPGEDEKVLEENRALEALAGELMGFCYFAATVREFFVTDLDEKRLRAAIDERVVAHSLDGLAAARAAFGSNLRDAWALVGEFRRRWGLPAHNFPGTDGRPSARSRS